MKSILSIILLKTSLLLGQPSLPLEQELIYAYYLINQGDTSLYVFDEKDAVDKFKNNPDAFWKKATYKEAPSNAIRYVGIRADTVGDSLKVYNHFYNAEMEVKVTNIDYVKITPDQFTMPQIGSRTERFNVLNYNPWPALQKGSRWKSSRQTTCIQLDHSNEKYNIPQPCEVKVINKVTGQQSYTFNGMKLPGHRVEGVAKVNGEKRKATFLINETYGLLYAKYELGNGGLIVFELGRTKE